MAGDESRRSGQMYDAPLRRYHVSYLSDDGQIGAADTLAPALPAFEDAFCAMGRGTILHRPTGPIAVEEVQPGDMVQRRDGGFAQVLWCGMTSLPPATADNLSQMLLTRIRTDALGIGQPMQDLILGPAARLRLRGQPAVYVPASDYIDGDAFIGLRPRQPVDLYQLGCAVPETLLANGIGVASLHLGTVFGLGLRGDLLAQYNALFAHLGPPAGRAATS